MSIVVSITEEQLLTALRTFLLTLVPVGTEVIDGNDNRTPMPITPFVMMTTLRFADLSVSRSTYNVPTDGTANGSENNATDVQWNVQIDCFGSGASSNANTIARLIKTPYAVQQFDASGLAMAPLYATEVHNTTMINGEQQYEQRFTFEFVAQFNPVIQTPMQFANEVTVGIQTVESLS